MAAVREWYMALSQDLIAFVKESLHRGLPRADVERVLMRAGWPAEQVRRALHSFSDVEFAIPVPRPVPSESREEHSEAFERFWSQSTGRHCFRLEAEETHW